MLLKNIYIYNSYDTGSVQGHQFRGVGRNFSRGVLNVTFQKGYFWIDLSTKTLYRKCIKFAPKKGGGRPTPPTLPFLRPCNF